MEEGRVGAGGAPHHEVGTRRGLEQNLQTEQIAPPRHVDFPFRRHVTLDGPLSSGMGPVVRGPAGRRAGSVGAAADQELCTFRTGEVAQRDHGFGDLAPHSPGRVL